MNKYKSFVIVGFCLSLALCGCSFAEPKGMAEDQALSTEQKEFDAYLEDQLVETLEGDYYTMHSLVQDPSSLGIDPSSIEKTWGRFDEKTMKEDRAEIAETCLPDEDFARTQ